MSGRPLAVHLRLDPCVTRATRYNIGMLDLAAQEDAVILPVKVVPGASQTRYCGPWKGRARIAVTAPPEKGQANKAVKEFLAGMLRLRRSDVSIIAGHSSPLKTIRIDRVTMEAVRTALQLARS